MRSYPCKIVGLKHEGRLPYILEHVREGDDLALVQEPDNEYDEQAVAVFHRRRKIGYIPSDKKWVWKSIEEGDTHEVKAVGLHMGEDGEPGAIAINITITSDGNQPVTLTPSPISALPAKSTQYTSFQKLALLVVLGGVGAAALWINGQSPTGPRSASAGTKGAELCPQVASKAPEVISSWRKAGVISSDNLSRMTVREGRWRNAGNDARVSIALAAFCIQNPSGSGTLMIRSHENDDVVMSVEDGNVLD